MQFLNSFAKLYLFLALMLTHVLVSGQYAGTVFHDTNLNGVQDGQEKGLEGATVSNGLQVTTTDANGKFELPSWEKARFITIYPRGIEKPLKRYLDLIGESANYDFAMQKVAQQKSVKFIHISDTETYEYKEWVNNLKSLVKNEDIDFIVHTGDICYHSGIKWHAQDFVEEDLGVPVYYCLGNHDLTAGKYGEEFFEDHLGPAWYAVEKGNALFVITPMMSGDFKPGFTRAEIGEWMQNVLDAYPSEMPKYFFNHDLLTNGGGFEFKVDEDSRIRLNDYNLKAWVFGHWHINMTKTHMGTNIKSYSTASPCMGGIDHSPSSVRIVEVDQDGSSSSRIQWTYVDKSIYLLAPSEGKAHLDQDGRIPISVNTYSSASIVDSVKYTIKNADIRHWDTAKMQSEMIKMTQTSDWNWVARALPSEDVTSYEILVYSFLRGGEVLHESHKFSIEATTPQLVAASVKWENLAGNPQHDAAHLGSHADSYELNWVTNMGSNVFMSSPVLSGGKVYTSTFDDGNASNNHIICTDAETGRVVWKTKTKNGIKNQIVISGDLVIGTDMQGFTYACDLRTGALKWELDLGYDKLPGFVSGIVTKDGVVYTGYGSSLKALEAQTGEIIWENAAWDGGEGSTPTMTLADEVLIASSNWRALYGHDKNTGELLWKRADDGLRFRNGTVSYIDSSLWVAENLEGTGTLHELDPRTGETITQLSTGMSNQGTSAPVITEDYFFVAGSHPGLAAFDRKTKEKLWQFEVQAAIFYTPQYYADRQQSIESTPLLIGESLLFGAMDGWLYNLDSNTGRLLWKTNLGSPVVTTAAVTEIGFFICDFAGNLYSFVSKP